MYLSFYNFKTKPFPEKIEPAQFWLNEKTEKAFETFWNGIRGNKGIFLLTGDVGTGKTAFVDKLVSSFAEEITVGFVVNPRLDKFEFLKIVANAFHLKKSLGNRNEFLTHFKEFLVSNKTANKNVLLVVDEAQQLSASILEEIQQLSEIEKNGSKYLHILLVGQNEINTILFQPENLALRKKIFITCKLTPLTMSETIQYIQHHLRIAGSEENIFSSEAIQEIFIFSGGLPRLINIICNLALISGYTEEEKVISKKIIKDCIKEHMLPNQRPKEFQPFPEHEQKDQKFWQQTLKKVEKIPGWLKPSYGIILIVLILVFFAGKQLLYEIQKTESPGLGGDQLKTSSEIAAPRTEPILTTEQTKSEESQPEHVGVTDSKGKNLQAVSAAVPTATVPAVAQVTKEQHLHEPEPTPKAIEKLPEEIVPPAVLSADIAKPIPSVSDTDSKTAPVLAIESQAAIIPIADNQTSSQSEIPVATLKPERTKIASAEATSSPTPAEVESKSPTETEKPPEVLLPEQKQLDHPIKISEVLPSSEMSIKKTNDPEALKWAEKSYESVSQGNFTNAIDEATRAISFDPGLVIPYINRAWAYIEIGQYDKAIADCRTAIKLDPDNALAVNNLGLAYHRMGKLQMAEEHYKKACDMELEIACNNYNIFVKRLSVLNIIQESQEALRQKKWDTVLQLTSDIFQLDTNNETARMMRTEAIKQKEHHQQALKWAEKSYESVSRGNFTNAIDEATISISFDSELVIPYVNRAWAYIEIGQYDKAITDCHTAIKLDPDNALAINNLGLAYHRMGKLQMARKHYKKACDLNMNIACENYKSLSSSE